MAQVTIPPLTLPLGPSSFAPITVGRFNRLVMEFDRTIDGGLTATPAASIDILIQTADDPTNGPWFDAFRGTVQGGIDVDDNGVTRTTDDLILTSSIDTRTGVQFSATVNGALVAVAGTITTDMV